MKSVLRLLPGLALLLAGAAQPLFAADTLTVRPLEPEIAPEGLPQLPAMDWEDPEWSGEPVYDQARDDQRYRVWIGAAPQGLLFRVLVNDPEHSREYYARSIWRGDAIYIGLDARGDTTGEELETDDFGTDDASLIFGYGANGPDAHLDRAGNPRLKPEHLLDMIRAMDRDDEAELTSYEIAVPWSAMETTWDQSPTVGVAMTFKDDNISETEDVDWGSIRSRNSPREYSRFAVPDFGGDVHSLTAKMWRMRGEDESAQLVLSWRSDEAAAARFSVGSEVAEIELPAGGEISRWQINVPHSITTEGGSALALRIARNGELVMEKAVWLESPTILHQELTERIERLLKDVPHPLVESHLRSTLRVVDSVYQSMDLPGDRGGNEAELFIDTVSMILQKLPENSFDWERHKRQALPLVFAFTSDRDMSLQFYGLQLPYGWQEGETYPLTIYLHGAGNPHPLGGLSVCFTPEHQDTIFREVDIDRNDVPAAHKGFLLAPWCRGNSAYRDAAEDDLWQAIDLVRGQFSVDPDRMYLTGFSMGGGGTWNIGGRTPDIWAAISPAAGSMSPNDATAHFLADNLEHVPVLIWCGEEDGLLPRSETLAELLEERGAGYELRVAPKLPHTYPYLEYQNNVAWLMQHTRKLPREWTYTTDTNDHSGSRGISMRVPRLPDPEALPAYTARIDGQTLTIDTQNTDGIGVNLGEEGLGMTGDVTVIWNGETIHTGPPERITAGEPMPRWWE